MATHEEEDRLLIVTRVIAAPRALVWRAWTAQGHIEKWWGPTGFTTTTHHRDLRAGGEWRFTMHGPDGRDYENRVVFDTIEEPRRIAFRHSGGGNTEKISFLNEFLFEEVDGGTRVTIRQVHPSKEARDFVVREFNALEGGNQTLARLDVFARSLDASG